MFLQPCQPSRAHQEDQLYLTQQFLADHRVRHKVRVLLRLHQNHGLDLDQIQVFRNPTLVRVQHSVRHGVKTLGLILYLDLRQELILGHLPP